MLYGMFGQDDSQPVLCPDTGSYDLRLYKEELIAYISTCTDVLEKLGTGDPSIECEQDNSKI